MQRGVEHGVVSFKGKRLVYARVMLEREAKALSRG